MNDLMCIVFVNQQDKVCCIPGRIVEPDKNLQFKHSYSLANG